MVSKSLIILIFSLFISLVFASDGNPENGKLNNEQQNYQDSSLLEDVQQVGNKRKRWLSLPSLIFTSNNFKNAVDQQHKLDLEFVTETTRLEELNKLRDAEKIDETTPSAKLSRWQKRILKDISKSRSKKEILAVKSAASKTLAEKLKNTSDDTVKSKRQIKDRVRKLAKSLEDQQKTCLDLIIMTKKLEELKKQRESEHINVLTAPIKLTKFQRNLVRDIARTKEKKGDLTVAAAISRATTELLKKQLIDVGGSLDDVTNISTKLQKEINEKIHKSEAYLSKIDMDLALITEKLNKLEKSKEDEEIDENNLEVKLTRKQKNLLNDIERAKEKKYDLTLKAALESTLIEQLKLQLNPKETSSVKGVASS